LPSLISEAPVLPAQTSPVRSPILVTGAAFAFFLFCLGSSFQVFLRNSRVGPQFWPLRSDDLFYYLVIVRRSVQDGVVSMDGIHPTNGFHPLYFLVLRWLYPHVAEAALPGLALLLLATAHVATSVTLWGTLRRQCGNFMALLVAGAYACNPDVLKIIFRGVETSIAVLFVSLALLFHLKWLESPASVRNRAASLCFLSLGVASRTDTAFLCLALALSPCVFGSSRPVRGKRWRDFDLAPVLAGVVPVALFAAWSHGATGEWLQTSGRALSYWQSLNAWSSVTSAISGHVPAGLSAPVSLLVYELLILGALFMAVGKPFVELLTSSGLGWLVLALLVWSWRTRREEAGVAMKPAGIASNPRPLIPSQLLTRQLLLFLCLLWGFYSVFFRHCHDWYWHSSLYAAAVLVGLNLAPAARWFESSLTKSASSQWAVCLGLILAMPVALHPLRALAPLQVADTGFCPADPLPRLVPPHALVGAFDSGVISWTYPDLRVVNLDGVINNSAYRAIRAHDVGGYLEREHVHWLLTVDDQSRFQDFGLNEYLKSATIYSRIPNGMRLYHWNPVIPPAHLASPSPVTHLAS